jgi:hypothetical protein
MLNQIDGIPLSILHRWQVISSRIRENVDFEVGVHNKESYLDKKNNAQFERCIWFSRYTRTLSGS